MVAAELGGYDGRLGALAKAHPLAVARLWDRPVPATSQRRCLVDPKPIVLVAGGNRSGKTSLAAQLCVAAALGRADQVAQLWCAGNGLDPAVLLPEQPGRVWAVAPDNGDSREYVRPAVGALLPPGCQWSNRDGWGPAEVRLPGGGRIGFKSVDEGRDGFQGTAKDLIWFDEEPDDEGVVDEAMMRTPDRRGRVLVTMTPLRGRTWLWRRWVAELNADVGVHRLTGSDNPHMPPGALEAVLRRYGAHQRAAREHGEFTVLEGRVYGFRRELHVIPSFAAPRSWPRYGGIDFGTRNPFCFLLFAHDRKDDVLHVIAEHYAVELTLARHAAAIRALLRGQPEPDWIVADPEDRGSRLSLAQEHGISTLPARKERAAGISAVAERLAPDAEGRPHLVVHDCCTHLVREAEGYAWAAGDNLRERTEGADHALDVVRYVCMQLRRSEFGVA